MKPFLIGICCLSLGAAAAAQDSLATARDLYASAAYEEALSALTRLEKTSSVGTELEDQYRAFSLFALGRTPEAETVAERLITKNPLLELDGDASPRIVTMFADVRKRLLPGLIRDKYRTARALVDRKDFAAAEPQLKTVKQMLDESARVGAADDMSVDLGLLVDGFLGLIQREAAADARMAEAEVKSSAPAAVTSPAVEALSNAAAADNAAGPAASSPGPASPVGTSRSVPPVVGVAIYGLGSPNVIPPVVLRQDAPGFPAQLATTLTPGPKTGTIEVLIDEKGNVERAVMSEFINPIYDRLLMTDAKKWKYRPAVKDQIPVKFLKTVAIFVNIENVTGSVPR
jgi:hypothetical protein